MGSMVVKIEKPIAERIANVNRHSDIDILTPRSVGMVDEVPMAYGDDAITMSIRNILMWRVGESVISPEFGHNLNRSMYSQITDMNKQQVCEEIKRAIEENEPRVKVESVSMDNSDSDDWNGVVRTNVRYRTIDGKIGNVGAEMNLK